MGLAVVGVIMVAGTLRLDRIVELQSGLAWNAFLTPIGFITFVVASFAETNRLPFDLPEAEQELAGGYNVEYSSMKFALFFMGEYAAMAAGSAMLVTLFLGGWTLPFAGLDQPAITILGGLLHIGIFLGKMVFIIFMMIWVRWMWPRFRYDQLMDLGWKRSIPLSLANIVVTAVILYLMQK
jgi:NADH-quinone oxidoreductase subunit H